MSSFHTKILDVVSDLSTQVNNHTHEISEINGLEEKLNSTGDLTLEKFYPVTRLWMTVEADQQPGTVLGFGTWEHIDSISLSNGVQLHIYIRMK